VGEESLRTTAIQGGAYLAVREILGIGLRAVGIIIITRIIGPGAFGTYAGAAAFATLIANASQMGMEVYLIRQPEDPSDELYHQVFTFLLLLSTLVASVAVGVSFLAAHFISGIAAEQQLFLVLMISVPINVLWAPAQAKIERAFGYKRMAWLELGGDVTFYLVAVILALVGAGAWSLVIGFLAWQLWLLVLSFRFAGMWPRLRWSSSVNRDLLRHGLPYSTTGILGAATGLISPIVVGISYGAVGVGYVSLALRLIDTLSFGARATWRLGMVALSKVRDQADRLARGIEQAMLLQLLATVVPILSVCVLANWLIPTAFGRSWVPMIPVLVWLGLARIASSPLTIEFAALYVASRNFVVTIATALNGVATLVFALILVPTLGIVGYGVAVLLSVVTRPYTHRKALEVAQFSSWSCTRLMVPLMPIAFFPLVEWPYSLMLFIPTLLVLAFPSVRKELVSNGLLVWNGVIRSRTVTR
jgi:PST family polysaccharide transporter